MELVYLWVEDYKNIHKQGFNFSPQFNCEFKDEYDEDGKLKDNCELVICDKKNNECKDNDYIEDFFGDNINVTAIVGKNGSGKSSLLELIIDFSDAFEKNYKIIYVVREGNDLIIYRNNITSPLNTKNNIIQKKFERSSNNKANIRYRFNYAYLSLSPFLNNMDHLYRGVRDKKYLASIYNYRDDYNNKTFNYTDFYLRMIPKIPSLLKQKYIKNLFNVKGSPKYLVLRFNKYLSELLNDEFMKVDRHLKKINQTEKEYTYELALTDVEGFKTLENLIEKFESKKNEFEIEKNEFEIKLKKDESKGLLPEPLKTKKSNFDKMYDDLYKKPYRDTSDEESVQSKVNYNAPFFQDQ